MIGMVMMIFALRDISPIGAGIIGGVLHNVGQLLVAVFVHNYPVLYTYIALLVIVGAVMGGITGTIVVRLRHFLPYERRKQFGFVTRADSTKTA
jgi:uncharacterized membrane protein